MFNEYGDMVTLDELCQMLGIGRNNAYNLLREKKIQAFKLGRVWKIPKIAVIEYVKQCYERK